ncbi:MAG: hypothetical protein ACOY0T_38405 [Myxococcota bacterium]
MARTSLAAGERFAGRTWYVMPKVDRVAAALLGEFDWNFACDAEGGPSGLRLESQSWD